VVLILIRDHQVIEVESQHWYEGTLLCKHK